MKKFGILLVAVFCGMTSVKSQTEVNPLAGAWQSVEVDDAGGVVYNDIVKVYTPGGLLKGVGKLQTQKDAYMWLDGSYELTGNDTRGTYTEHCTWHHLPAFSGQEVAFDYAIDNDTLILTYKGDPKHSEMWVRVARPRISSYPQEDPETLKRIRKCVNAYKRDKASYANKPFELAGLWRTGSLSFVASSEYVRSAEDVKKQMGAYVDFNASDGGYALLCEDGFALTYHQLPPLPAPRIPEILEIADEEDEDGAEGRADDMLQKKVVPAEHLLTGYECVQYSVLSPTELGIDYWYSRLLFVAHGKELYHVLRVNAAGQLWGGLYYWKSDIKQRYPVKISFLQPEEADNSQLKVVEVAP